MRREQSVILISEHSSGVKPRLEDPDGIDGLLDEQLYVAADKASLTSAMAAQAAFADLMSVHQRSRWKSRAQLPRQIC